MQYARRLEVIVRDDLQHCPRWQFAFANERKDHRYYELVEDTLHPEFDYRYFVIKDAVDQVCSVQPFFLMDLDLLVGASPRFGMLIDTIRRMWPRLMRARIVSCLPCASRFATNSAGQEPAIRSFVPDKSHPHTLVPHL